MEVKGMGAMHMRKAAWTDFGDWSDKVRPGLDRGGDNESDGVNGDWKCCWIHPHMLVEADKCWELEVAREGSDGYWLLYAVFVVSNENTSVAELATTLQADLSQLQAAASFVCRLGWATKVIDPSSILQDTNILGSPRSAVSDEDASHGRHGFDNMLIDDDTNHGDASGSHGPRSAYTRVAFIVDANITSYLMMGSVSPGLKSHAVTLYEAGKLGHASIADLCKDLSTLEGAKFEGELQEFANHAFSLRCVLECLQSGGVASDVKVEEGFDKMDMATSGNDDAGSQIDEISLADKSGDSGITEAGMNTDDLLSLDLETSVGASVASEAVPSDGISSITLEGDGNHIQEASKDENHQNDEKLMVEGSDAGTEMLKRKKKYRVDILRCESLASLAPATLDRLFLRDYDMVVSIVPLPHSSVLPGHTDLVHFGPPSYSFMTPWMKLILYSTVSCGPLSVVLMKGQCLRLLPAPLAGCEKALIWSWDGSTVGGLGGKLDGNLVKGSILLHCLNSLLKHSAVLVQPLSKFDLDESGKVITMDIPLPLKNSDGSVTPVGKELGLCEEENSKLNSLLTDLANKMELWTVGYIRLLRLFNERESDQFSPEEQKYDWVPLSVEFGMPLFSPKLCNNICKRVVSSELLQSGSFDEHHHAMKSLRKNLRDICAEYQAIGPAAKLLYQKEQAKESPRQLMNYASGRWNPLMDPSSPISGASSEHQRSYALAPIDESIEEVTQANTIKAESDENDSKDVILPGVNLLFDGSELHPFDIGACLQARQPISLITEAAAASATLAIK
ncbi:FAM91, N-terminal domain [Sesbania bispinosa]|nr:FAM91, N-terminal domain [Sesbania bispinosa]